MPVCSFAQWSPPVNISHVPSGCTVGEPHLAVDSFGTVHACYVLYKPNGDHVCYTCKRSNTDTWTIPVVVSRDSVHGKNSAIGIGPGLLPHILWQTEDVPGDLWIAHPSGDTWSIPERLADWHGPGRALRAAADSFERLHAIWFDSYSGASLYSRYDAGGWSRPETIVVYVDTFKIWATDLALDRGGYAHVSCRRSGGEDTFPRYYVRQAESGWTRPVALPATTWHGGGDLRIGLDQQDRPHFLWGDQYHTTYSCWTGDSWTRPETLNCGLSGGRWPAVYIDRWSQIHAVFYIGHLVERIRWHGMWSDTITVDPNSRGWTTIAAGPDRLHSVQANVDVYYCSRPLTPPAIEEPVASTQVMLTHTVANLITPSSAIVFDLARPSRVAISVFDASGREVGSVYSGFLGAGSHRFRPCRYLSASGVFYCRIKAGNTNKVVKLVRVN